ncbi:MAG: protein kinase [Candidatus Aureabacteria bacterium]|nr:protein kinase [Candidatus Auribacterota bacterium]
MDTNHFCQACGEKLSEKPEQKKSVKCPFCGYVNSVEKKKFKTLAEQLADLTVELRPEDINNALSTVSLWLGNEIAGSQNIGETIKTTSERVTQYVSHVKRKAVETHEKGEGDFDYKLIEKIGEGGMGVIYLADQNSLKRTVALKMTKESRQMTDAMTEHFLTEALVTGDFDHPNVVPIHDAGIDHQGRLFYIMKRVQGVTWESILHPKTEEEKKLSETYSLTDHLNILNSVCNAVAFAHSRNVIHRDLKPSNVMIGEFGEVIVLDWGLAASIGENDKVATLEEMNAFGGTVSYMAPEMARAQKSQIGKHSDIYLLGAVLYEILTGHPPHAGKTMKEAIINAVQNKIEPPENEQDIDMVLMETALKAMSLKPLQRYFSVSNFQRALKRYIRGKTSHLGSVRLSRKAMEFLKEGVETADVKIILRSYILFERALRLWNGNREAEMGKHKSEHFLLKASYESGEIDLLFSFMREKSLHVDFKLQYEKERYIIFRQKHPVISFVFSRNIVYRFLSSLDQALILTLKRLNHLLKLLFVALLLVLPLVLYRAGAPLSYVVSLAVVSVTAVFLGDFFLRKSIQKKKSEERMRI